MENRHTPHPEVTVALQGTIETFALPDVMRLLASTKKTGRLRLSGGRGSGSIWVDSGRVVASEAGNAPHANGPVEVVFELLRFTDGDFVFDADESPDDASAPVEVEPTLTEAEAMLDEWKGIEAVVPSLDAWVALAAALPGPEVSVDADRWSLIVAVGSGATVGTLGDILSLGEMPISKRVKELIEAGLAEVGITPAGATTAPRSATRSTEAPASTVDEPGVTTSGGAPGLDLAPVPDDGERFDPDALVVEREPVVDSMAPSAATAGSSEPSDAAEIARQLANLSPKAAKAVAAAAKATTEEERELALAEVDDEEDPINRDLLIKFLGSVNG